MYFTQVPCTPYHPPNIAGVGVQVGARFEEAVPPGDGDSVSEDFRFGYSAMEQADREAER